MFAEGAGIGEVRDRNAGRGSGGAGGAGVLINAVIEVGLCQRALSGGGMSSGRDVDRAVVGQVQRDVLASPMLVDGRFARRAADVRLGSSTAARRMRIGGRKDR